MTNRHSIITGLLALTLAAAAPLACDDAPGPVTETRGPEDSAGDTERGTATSGQGDTADEPTTGQGGSSESEGPGKGQCEAEWCNSNVPCVAGLVCYDGECRLPCDQSDPGSCRGMPMECIYESEGLGINLCNLVAFDCNTRD